jgi:hypothetical protein
MDSVPIGAQWQGGGAVADSGPVECGSSGTDDRERIVAGVPHPTWGSHQPKIGAALAVPPPPTVIALPLQRGSAIAAVTTTTPAAAVITSRRARLTAANPRAGNPPVGSA